MNRIFQTLTDSALVKLRQKRRNKTVPIRCVDSLNRFRKKLSSGISTFLLSVILNNEVDCSLITYNVGIRILDDKLPDSIGNPSLSCFSQRFIPVENRLAKIRPVDVVSAL